MSVEFSSGLTSFISCNSGYTISPCRKGTGNNIITTVLDILIMLRTLVLLFSVQAQ